MISLPLLDPAAPERFPDPARALSEPNGLLAFGGDLSVPRLRAAYAQGIFPWFNEGEPILWWSPDPRCVFETARLQVDRSVKRLLRRTGWRVTADCAFAQVIEACATPRPNQAGTWISPVMLDAYNDLHRAGDAHSVEVWEGTRLVGGIYGVASGRLFSGESMFSRESGGSRIALLALARQLHHWGFPLLDAQVANPHLLGLGAVQIERRSFLRQHQSLSRQPTSPAHWQFTATELDLLADSRGSSTG